MISENASMYDCTVSYSNAPAIFTSFSQKQKSAVVLSRVHYSLYVMLFPKSGWEAGVCAASALKYTTEGHADTEQFIYTLIISVCHAVVFKNFLIQNQTKQNISRRIVL